MTIYNVKDSHGTDEQGNPLPGAQGDGVTNDLQAIQRALDAAANAGGGIVLIPPGIYVITWMKEGNPGLQVKSSVTLMGSGVGNTTLRQAPPWVSPEEWGDNLVLLYAKSSHDIAIRDMTLDGGQSYQPGTTGSDQDNVQHCHGIRFQISNRISVDNVRIMNCAGDGIAIHAGQPGTPPSTEVLIENCSIDTVWRIGISLGRDFLNTTIRGCTFQNWDDFAIKAEFEGESDNSALDRGLTVEGCVCLPPSVSGPANAGSISVYGDGAQIIRDIVIAHNTLLGVMRFAQAHHMLIEGNTLTQVGASPALDCWGGCDDLVIRHNTILYDAPAGVRLGRNAIAASNTRVVLSDNLIQWIGLTAPAEGKGQALEIVDATSLVFDSNLVRGGAVGTTPWVDASALRVAPTPDTTGMPPHVDVPVRHLTLTHNIIQGYRTGIQLDNASEPLSGTQALTDLIVTDNVLEGCEVGVWVDSSGVLFRRLALSGNVIVQPVGFDTRALWFSQASLPYLIGGSYGQDAVSVGFFVGSQNPDTSPEARIQNAAVGSLYLNSTTGWLWMREMYNGSPTWTHL